jgi:alkylation response protein AidB-like acyl-CoA dehydrogenase
MNDEETAMLEVGGDRGSCRNWIELIRALGPHFARRAATHDASDTFVTENFAELKKDGVLAAGIPSKLGGGGATYREQCDMLRELAHHCGSTALALSMHTHLVAGLVWRWGRDAEAVENLLQRIVDNRLVLVSTGSSDWLEGTGTAERHEGGWHVTGRKRFCSGVPVGDLLMTGAVHNSEANGSVVLHFPLCLRDDNVRIVETWQVLGMRGTGSHDVALDSVFVPDSAVFAARPQGKWHPLMYAAMFFGPPLVYSVYLGIAEAARDLSLELVRTGVGRQELPYLVGEMENELATARVMHADMIRTVEDLEPNRDTTNRILMARTVASRAAIHTVEKAMEVAGGRGFYRTATLERHFRDIQAARYHSPTERAQQHYTGCLVLGLDP